MVDDLGHGRFRVNGRLAYGVRERAKAWVFIDGHTYVIEPESRDASHRPPGADDPLALSAPMPATVIAVEVAPGQDVVAGDLLVLLEAMKMEVPIKAPRNGRVKSVGCREGELVQPGIALLELE